MITKINFTNRKRILHKYARISLLKGNMGKLQIDASIKLEEYKLSSMAIVFVEAYHGTLCKRYNWGCVGNRTIPTDLTLPRFADPKTIMFRVKIVDQRDHHGRIIAAADNIHPRSLEKSETARVPLLHVKLEENMGERIWKLDLSGDWPELHLNGTIEGIKAIARTDIHFLSLVFPAVVSEILKEIILVQEINDPDYDDNDWQPLWLRFVIHIPGVVSEIPNPEDKEDVIEWIESAIYAFCKYHRTREKYFTKLKELEQ